MFAHIKERRFWLYSPLFPGFVHKRAWGILSALELEDPFTTSI